MRNKLLFGKRGGLHRIAQLLLVDMGVDLRGRNILVPQDLLERQHIDAALVHQRSGGVAQLVGRKPALAQPGALQAAFHDLLHTAGGQPLAGLRDEQRVTVLQMGQRRTGFAVGGQRLLAGVVEVDEPFFAAFAGDADGIVAEIAHIDGHQLRQAHAAV